MRQKDRNIEIVTGCRNGEGPASRHRKATQVMMKIKKLDIAELERAAKS
jgi:hypothetical protein